MSRMKISRNGLYLIESFEGFRAKAVSLPGGRYTIGFGHAVTAREGMVINREQAEQLLLWDLIPVEEAIRSLVHAPINQNQFDALGSFVFNIGIEKFKESDILKYLNQGQLVNAAMAMNLWRRSLISGRSIVVDALIRRRAHEIAMFLEPIGTRPAAPSPVVIPLVDNTIMTQIPDAEDVKEIKPIPQSAAFEITEDKTIKTAKETNNDVVTESHSVEGDDLFTTDADIEFLNAEETENNLKILDDNVSVKSQTVTESIVEKTEVKDAVIAKGPIAKTNDDIFVSHKVEDTNKTDSNLSSNDIANYFMIGAGAIALIASVSELIRFGVFTGGTELTPNIAFIEMIAAVGLIAITIGILSKLKS